VEAVLIRSEIKAILILISANSIAGILIENSPSNTFKNNYLGTDLTGDALFMLEAEML
jgi:hypothetical protein